MFQGVENRCSHHAPIDAEKHFRLAIFCEATEEVPMSLVVFPHDDSNASRDMTYSALSYYVGDPKDTRQVILNHIYSFPNMTTGAKGLCVQHCYNITSNLYRALSHVRNMEYGNTEAYGMPIWIDAICINQSDTHERSRQVMHMGDLYSNASLVVVWLDLRPDIDIILHAAARELKKKLRGRFGHSINTFNLSLEMFRYLNSIRLCIDEDEQLAILGLNQVFKNPWFSRIWVSFCNDGYVNYFIAQRGIVCSLDCMLMICFDQVLQELFRANANAVFSTPMYRPILASDLMLTFGYFQARASMSPLRRQHLQKPPRLWMWLARHVKTEMNRLTPRADDSNESVFIAPPQRFHLQDSTKRVSVPLQVLFGRAMVFGATDPRDKVFAILGLAGETEDPDNMSSEITPNYDKTTVQVFTDLTRYIIRVTMSLDVLSDVGRSGRQIHLPAYRSVTESFYKWPPEDLPTWSLWHTPGIARSGAHEMLPPYARHAITGHKEIDTSLIQGNKNPLVLPLRGKYLDEIEHVVPWVLVDEYVNGGYNTDALSKEPVLGILHLSWTALLSRLQYLRNEHQHSNVSVYGTDEELFDAFLSTLLCTCGKTSGRDERESDAPASLEAKKIYEFTCYWLLTHPQVVSWKGEDKSRRTVNGTKLIFDGDLPAGIKERCNQALQASTGPGKTPHWEFRKDDFEHYVTDIRGRPFFISKRGFIGLCPCGARAGDALVGLHGAKYASILRLAPNEPLGGDTTESTEASSKDKDRKKVDTQGWHFIGEALVHRWMDGGAFVQDLAENENLKDEVFDLF